ncbi:MAG: hypothetical protein ACR2PA_09665, partial [Hyphomicrobiaceae bacterium]
MRQLLKSAPLDFARDPLMQLVREDWIWHGEQLLDGLYCARDDSLVPDWRAALAPHVQHADAILESDAAAIVLFDGPQKVDCDVLGQALPLRIQHGALSSFPFKPPNDSRLANAVNDSVLIMQFGKVERTMLGAFQNTKPGDWFDTSDMTIEQGIAPPRRPGMPDVATLKTTGQKLFEGAYPDAGLRKVRDAVGQVPTRTNWIDMIGPIGRATVFALLAIILVVMVAQSGMSAAGLTYAVVGIIAASIGFGLVRLLAAKRGARPAPTKPRRRQAPATRRPADGLITTIAFVAVIAFVMVSAFTDSTGNLWSALASILIAGAVLGLLSWVGARLGLGGTGSGAEHEAAEAAQSDPL